MIGMRVHDLIQTVRLMRREHREIYVIGLGGGGLVALHAAAIDKSISGVATFQTLVSYKDVLERAIYVQPASSFVPGALAHYDLPLLSAWIRPRPCAVIRPFDAGKQPLRGEPAPPAEAAAVVILKGLRLS